MESVDLAMKMPDRMEKIRQLYSDINDDNEIKNKLIVE